MRTLPRLYWMRPLRCNRPATDADRSLLAAKHLRQKLMRQPKRLRSRKVGRRQQLAGESFFRLVAGGLPATVCRKTDITHGGLIEGNAENETITH